MAKGDTPLEHAMQLLALLSDGSTLRQGPHRVRAKELVQTLRIAQAQDGAWSAPSVVASQITAEAWCTLAVALTAHRSAYALLARDAELATRALLRNLPKADGASVELVVPCALLAEVLQDAGSVHEESLRRWLASWLDGKAPLGQGVLLPEVAARLLVAEVLARGDAGRDATATAHAKECTTRFRAAVAEKRTRLDELTLLALGWCHLSTERLAGVGFPGLELERALIAVRGEGAPRGPWTLAAGPFVATAVATILESMGHRFSRLARS